MPIIYEGSREFVIGKAVELMPGKDVTLIACGLMVAEAIRIFELNTEDYPQAFNPWDSLGEAHKAAGHKEEAVRAYRKSVELNPANTNAVKMLEELGAEP